MKQSSNSQGQPTQKTKSWRRTAPTPGSPETINKDGRKYYWCQKCKRWTETHGTADHKVGFKKDDQNNNSNSYANVAAASLAVDPSLWYCPMPAFNFMDFIIELFKLWFGLFVYLQVSPLVVTFVQYLTPLLQVHKRDLLMLSLSPLLTLVLYYFISWIMPQENKRKKKSSRWHRRMYQQHVRREVRRYRRRRSRSPPPRVGRQYPLRLRRQGIYNHRSQAPTHLDQAAINIMRDLRFELRRPPTTFMRHPNSASGPSVPRHRRRNRRQRHIHPRRNQDENDVQFPAPPPINPIVCMATTSSDATPSSTWSSLLKSALQAPARFVNSMKRSDAFPIVWDSGASHCVTFDKGDFVSEIEDLGMLTKVQGIYSGLEVTGVGVVQWSIHAENGGLRHLLLPTLLVPKCKMRLLSTSVLLRTYPGEVINQH